MALARQKIPISFSQGINTKVDDKQLQVGAFSAIENAIFDTISTFRKRNGYDNVDLTKLDNSNISDPKALGNFLNELLIFTDTELYSYSQSINRWFSRGTALNVFPTSQTILRNANSQNNIDCIAVDGLDAFVYQDGSSVKVTIRDRNSENFLLTNTIIESVVGTPKVANIENDLYIIYRDTTNLKYKKINLLFPSTISSATTLVTDLDATNPKFDAIPVADAIFVAYNSSNAGGELTCFKILADGTATSAIGITGESPTEALTLSVDSLNRILVTYASSTDAKFLVRNTLNTATITVPTTIETISDIVNIVGLEYSQDNYRFIYEISAASTSNHYLKTSTGTIGATTGTATELRRGLGLASKLFMIESEVYALAVHDSEFQAGYFLINASGKVAAKISQSVGGNVILDNGPSKVTDLGDSKFLIGSQIKGKIVTDDGTFNSLLGVNATVFDFDLANPYQNTTLGQNLHIAAGYLNMYDGSSIVEHGFHLYPETLTAGATNTVGGSMSDGTYQYVAVYKWTDNKGQEHRSAPSIPLTVTLSGGGSTQIQTINIPTLRITEKQDVVLELYRTETTGTIFYLVTSVASPLINVKTVDTLAYVDTLSDTDLIDNEALYTNGGVLENLAAPASSLIESFNNRIFLAGLEDSNRLQYSKIRFEGRPVEFNDNLVINVNPEGGPITAIKLMDEKLIIFKTNSIYYLSGDGPNNLGQQDSFIEPELLSSNVGCVDVNSTVLTPLGIVFKSNKGIYLLSKDFSTQYIGAAVEAFNNWSITSAKLVPHNNQVRFLTANNYCLVFDYFVNQWSTFTNHAGQSSTLVSNDTYYYLRTDNKLYKENRSSFSDNGTPIKLKAITGWLSFAGLQNFKRVYKLEVLGAFKSEHKVRIKAAYDFNESFIDDKTIDTSSFTNSATYGNVSPYGSDPLYGTNGNIYQFRLDFRKQKCTSLKISIEDIQDTAGEGLSLSNMNFDIGIKSGTMKLNTATNQFGTDSNTSG